MSTLTPLIYLTPPPASSIFSPNLQAHFRELSLTISWYYNNDSHSNGLADDLSSCYCPRIVNDDVYPPEYHPFRQIVDAAVGYIERQEEISLYDLALIEFIDLAACYEGWLYWERELKFHRFFGLPVEMRFRVLDFYFQSERDAGKLQQYQHTD